MSDSASDPGSITNPMKFKNQDFVSLRDECLQSGKLFVDPSFTADQNSIGMPADPDPKMAIKWLRPKVSICTFAHLHICTRYPTAYYILLVLALSQDLNSLETHIRCYNKFLPGRVFYVISPRCAWPGHKTKDGMVVWKDQSDSLTAELVYE